MRLGDITTYKKPTLSLLLGAHKYNEWFGRLIINRKRIRIFMWREIYETTRHSNK